MCSRAMPAVRRTAPLHMASSRSIVHEDRQTCMQQSLSLASAQESEDKPLPSRLAHLGPSVHVPLPLALEALCIPLQRVRLRKLLYAADHEAAHEQQDDGGPGRRQEGLPIRRRLGPAGQVPCQPLVPPPVCLTAAAAVMVLWRMVSAAAGLPAGATANRCGNTRTGAAAMRWQPPNADTSQKTSEAPGMRFRGRGRTCCLRRARPRGGRPRSGRRRCGR